MTTTAYRQILNRVRSQGTNSGLNIVAFSGGVDSSLAAFFVHHAFPENSRACIGVSPSLSSIQLSSARSVADHIGIPLLEIETHEGKLRDYVANEGQSCYFCKTELYSTMKSIHQHLKNVSSIVETVVFNGTNADDLLDPTRVGLRAADEFGVASPLDSLPKQDVRSLARYVGLPNWNAAATPCLRSRLQFGVQATQENLSRIERAEEYIRSLLGLAPENNLRVRHLNNDIARIEVDPRFIAGLTENLSSVERTFRALGFDEIRVQEFASGTYRAENGSRHN
jgi:uncharacterized protein (TIGR00268 family)